jgi:hypothetical protein
MKNWLSEDNICKHKLDNSLSRRVCTFAQATVGHVHFVNIKSYTSNYNNVPTAIKIKHGGTTNAVALLLFPVSGTDHTT